MLRMTCGLHHAKNIAQRTESKGLCRHRGILLSCVPCALLWFRVDNSFTRSYNAAEKPDFGRRKHA
jgi:hypothetical protein